MSAPDAVAPGRISQLYSSTCEYVCSGGRKVSSYLPSFSRETATTVGKVALKTFLVATALTTVHALAIYTGYASVALHVFSIGKISKAAAATTAAVGSLILGFSGAVYLAKQYIPTQKP